MPRRESVHTLLRLALFGLVALPRSASAAPHCDSNLMIVLDRSCSMNLPPSEGETRTKWEITVDALGELTAAYADTLNFGLIMFPDQSGLQCLQDGPIYVNVGPDHADAVTSVLLATRPTGPCVTNIDTGIAQVFADPAFTTVVDIEPTDRRRSFVVLVSDGGHAGCADADANARIVATISELYEAGYPTFVVGFGGAVDPAALSGFAIAGGVARTGLQAYYQADGADGLNEVLHAIAGSLSGDLEFGCLGTPCPDGRCYGDYEQCLGGTCIPVLPDAAPAPDATPLPPDAQIASEPRDVMEATDDGCACRVGRPRRTGGVAGLALLGVLGATCSWPALRRRPRP